MNGLVEQKSQAAIFHSACYVLGVMQKRHCFINLDNRFFKRDHFVPVLTELEAELAQNTYRAWTTGASGENAKVRSVMWSQGSLCLDPLAIPMACVDFCEVVTGKFAGIQEPVSGAPLPSTQQELSKYSKMDPVLKGCLTRKSFSYYLFSLYSQSKVIHDMHLSLYCLNPEWGVGWSRAGKTPFGEQGFLEASLTG